MDEKKTREASAMLTQRLAIILGNKIIEAEQIRIELEIAKAELAAQKPPKSE